MKLQLLFATLFCALSVAKPPAIYADEAKAENKTAPLRVLCFGDSITAGGNMKPGEENTKWPLVIEKKSNGVLRLINEGKGGRPTNSVNEFREAIKKHEFDMLLILLGTNDSRDISEQCVSKAVANVKQMLTLAREKTPALRILLVGPPNINKNALGPTKPIANQREQKLKDLNAAFKELADETKCEFLSLFGTVPDDCLLRDGVHPDPTGNAAIAEKIYPALLPKS